MRNAFARGLAIGQLGRMTHSPYWLTVACAALSRPKPLIDRGLSNGTLRPEIWDAKSTFQSAPTGGAAASTSPDFYTRHHAMRGTFVYVGIFLIGCSMFLAFCAGYWAGSPR